MMITRSTIEKYVFNKPKTNEIIYVIPLIAGIFGLMLFSVEFLEEEFLLIAFIGSGILIGTTLSVTKNILFPIITILLYNLTITIQLGLIKPENIFEIVYRSIGDALFISIVIYWVVTFSQFILAKIKKLEKPSDERITMKKFVLGSIIAGFLYGLMMIINTV